MYMVCLILNLKLIYILTNLFNPIQQSGTSIAVPSFHSRISYIFGSLPTIFIKLRYLGLRSLSSSKSYRLLKHISKIFLILDHI